MRMPGLGLEVERERSAKYELRVRTHEENESLGKYLDRPIRIATITVSAGTVTGWPTTSSLFELWRAAPGVAAHLKGFGLFRGDPVVTVTVTGSPSMMGTLLVSFMPTATPNLNSDQSFPLVPPLITQAGWRFARANLPHLWCGVEEVKTYEIKLPFPSSNTALRTTSSQGVDQDYRMYAELAGRNFRRNDGNTPEPIKFEVYVRYENIELTQPISIQGGSEGPWLSSRLSYAADVMGAASTVFPFVTPWAAITGAMGKFAASMGFSRPIQVAMSTERIERTGNLSVYSGQPFFGQKLADDPAQATDVSGAFIPFTEVGDTTLSYVTSRPGLVYAWYAPTDSTRVEIDMDPMVVGVASPEVQLTPLAFAALPFRFWSGELEATIEFESNALVRCRYAIQVIPADAAMPTSYGGNTFFHTTLVDVVGRTRVKIPVPYYRRQLWDEMGGPYTAVNTLTTSTRLVVYALDALVAPLEIGMYVWIAAGPSFKLAYPTPVRLAAWSLVAYAAPPVALGSLPDITLPGGSGVLPGGDEEFDGLELHGCNEDPSLSMSCFGTNYTDLVALARKPQFLFSATGNTYTNVAFDPHDLHINNSRFGATATPVLVSSASLPVHMYLRSAYMGFSGGFRMTLINLSATRKPLVVSTYMRKTSGSLNTASTDNAGYSYGGCTVVPSTEEASLVSEFEGRADIPAAFRPGFVFGTTTGITNSPVVVIGGAPTDFNVWVSGADDYVFHGFLAPPILYTRGA